MYGLIHKTIKDYTISKYGVELWDEVISKTGFDSSMFLSLKP